MARVVSANSRASSEIVYVASRAGVLALCRAAGMTKNGMTKTHVEGVTGVATEEGRTVRARYHIGLHAIGPVNAPHPLLLEYPFAAPPAPGEACVVAPGVL